MEPVVSPWFFYWADVIPNLTPPAILLTVVSGVFGVFVLVCAYDDPHDDTPPKAVGLSLLTVAALALLVVIFTPSKDTLYKMAIASQVTPARVEQTINIVNKVYDQIIKDVKDLATEDDADASY